MRNRSKQTESSLNTGFLLPISIRFRLRSPTSEVCYGLTELKFFTLTVVQTGFQAVRRAGSITFASETGRRHLHSSHTSYAAFSFTLLMSLTAPCGSSRANSQKPKSESIVPEGSSSIFASGDEPRSGHQNDIASPFTSLSRDDDGDHEDTLNGDFMTDKELTEWLTKQNDDGAPRISNASTSRAASGRNSSAVVPRNLAIVAPLICLDSYMHGSIRLNHKTAVELKDGDFLRIVEIVQDTTTMEVTLRGWLFRRTREMNGHLERKLNEACWILHVDADDSREPKIQGMESFPVTEVVKRRRIRMTNQLYPALSWRDDVGKDTEQVVENERVLVCRSKYICVYPNAKARQSYAWCEKGLHRLRANECDHGSDNTMKDDDLRKIWRGESVKGGSRDGWLPGEREFRRQERLSDEGKFSRSSLKIGDREYPIDNPMNRGAVGELLDEHDIAQAAETNTSQVDSQGTARSSPVIIAQEGQHQRPPPRVKSKASANLFDSSDDDRGFEALENMIDIDEKLMKHSSRPRYRSPQVVEIDARIRTSSSRGTFQKHYESKVTSMYLPSSIVDHKKRTAEQAFGSTGRPSKRVDLSSRLNSDDDDIIRKASRPSVRDYDNKNEESGILLSSEVEVDRTPGLFQPPFLVEKENLPPAGRNYKMTSSGLFAPISQGDRSMASLVDLTIPNSSFPEYFENGNRSASGISVGNQIAGSSTSDESWKSYDFLNRQNNLPTSPRQPISRHTPAFFSRSIRVNPNHHNTNRSSTRPWTNARPSSSGPNLQIQPRFEAERTERNLKTEGKANVISSKQCFQRYTFGDCFCGAGGMSRGAVMAGLSINWAFDFNMAACQSYNTNFIGTKIYNLWAHQFTGLDRDHKCDICHLSPPCQFFSDAHTVQGKDDEMNTASLFAIGELLEKAKPRIVTLEQTAGLLRRHPIFFNAVTNIFTSKGFSIRWRLFNCADFGLPQRRLRLFVIASW